MTAEPTAQAGSVVELRFTLQPGDFDSVMKAWFTTRKGAFMYRPWFVAVLEVLALTPVVLTLADDGLAGMLPVYWLLPLLPALLVVAPRLVARASAKANAHHGEVTAVVTDEGVRYSSAHSQLSSAWSNFGRYLETPEAFLLLSPDKGGNMVYVLAKRGLASDADAERLRGLLAAHLKPGPRS